MRHKPMTAVTVRRFPPRTSTWYGLECSAQQPVWSLALVLPAYGVTTALCLYDTHPSIQGLWHCLSSCLSLLLLRAQALATMRLSGIEPSLRSVWICWTWYLIWERVCVWVSQCRLDILLTCMSRRKNRAMVGYVCDPRTSKVETGGLVKDSLRLA